MGTLPGPTNEMIDAVIACAEYKAKLRARIAALTAERDALLAGLEWLREEGVCVWYSGERDDDLTPIFAVHVLPVGSQATKEFWRYLAAACGRPELARYGTENDA